MPRDFSSKYVVGYCRDSTAADHEVQTNLALAKWLAEIEQWTFGGTFDPDMRGDKSLYFVPSQTLVGADAEALGVEGVDDLLGGYVQHAFVASKAISHPLFSNDDQPPDGWNPQFSERVHGVVLPGVTVFSLDQARLAATERLAKAMLRVKRVEACGGLGQAVLRDAQQLQAWLAGLDPEVCRHGIVIEENLEQARTHSVGQTFINGFLMTYYGEQFQTRNTRDECVYEGSRLTVVRGDYVDLLGRELDADVRRAIEYARTYDTAAALSFPGFFASRRNYDVVQGKGADGADKVGVLEQSWRVGGATGAELAALQAFRQQPNLHVVTASTHEIHTDQPLPVGARVLYRGTDVAGDFLLKYARVDTDER